jgi:hypothetical protein
MQSLSKTISVFSDGSYRLEQAAQPASVYRGFRCLHAKEGGFVNPDNMPNVRRAIDAPPVRFTAGLQQLAWDVMHSKNAAITYDGFRRVYGGTTAFTNGHGIESDDPKLMDGIICAGMFLPGDVEGGYLVARPGIHAVDANKPLPSAQQVLDRGWWFVANTGQGAEGAFNFPQGKFGPVYIVYALVEPVRYPLSWFARWDSDRLPDALRYGG